MKLVIYYYKLHAFNIYLHILFIYYSLYQKIYYTPHGKIAKVYDMIYELTTMKITFY